MKNSFSIIIPTLGRPSLLKTLNSIVESGLMAGDEIIVVNDGPMATERSDRLLLGWQFKVRKVEARIEQIDTQRTRGLGGSYQRDHGIYNATKPWLLFMDDDDVYIKMGLQRVRERLDHSTIAPHMFKMKHARDVLWAEKVVRNGNVSTHMFVTPNLRGRIGKWDDGSNPNRGSDLKFIESTLELWPRDSLVWCEEVVARCMRHSSWKEPADV